MGHTFERIGIATVGLDFFGKIYGKFCGIIYGLKVVKQTVNGLVFQGKMEPEPPHIGKIYGFLMFPVGFPLSQSND